MRIGYIPDVQAKPGSDFTFLARVGRYLAEKQPDVIVCAGDFADMESLSSYDRGKRSFEGRRYRRDIDAARRAMDTLMEPLRAAPGYDPRLVLTLGNHEDRIDRAANDQPELEGLVSIDDLEYEAHGWEVFPFLQVVTIGGVVFSHYLTSGVMGRPITTANALLTKRHMSCVVGHQQGFQIATAVRADGRMLTGIIAGSCYEHNETYMGPQGNVHYRGIVMLHDVREGEFDVMPVSLRYLKKVRYA
jgi:Icc-related predicted phosphoesterase